MLKNIQKMTVILLITLLAVSLAACGGEKPESTTAPAQPSTTVPAAAPATTVPAGTTVVQNMPTTAAPTIPAATAAPTTPVTTVAATTAAPTVPVTTVPPTTVAPTVPVTTVPPTTVAPTVPVTTVPPTTAAPVTNEFFNAKNNVISANQVTVTPRYVRYENGEILAECFVNNGTQKTVTAFQVARLAFADSNEQMICDATFPDVVNTAIAPNSSIVHTFRFPVESVVNQNAQLSTLLYLSNVNYASA